MTDSRSALRQVAANAGGWTVHPINDAAVACDKFKHADGTWVQVVYNRSMRLSDVTYQIAGQQDVYRLTGSTRREKIEEIMRNRRGVVETQRAELTAIAESNGWRKIERPEPYLDIWMRRGEHTEVWIYATPTGEVEQAIMGGSGTKGVSLIQATATLASTPPPKPEVKRLESPNDVASFALMHGLRHDWHEPDQITAQVRGRSFDNAGFDGTSAGDLAGTEAEEIGVTLFKEGVPVAEINLATLFSLAAEASDVPLVRELASNYHNNLLSAESAMDAIASAVL